MAPYRLISTMVAFCVARSSKDFCVRPECFRYIAIGSDLRNLKPSALTLFQTTPKELGRSARVVLCLLIVLSGSGLITCDTCMFPNRWTGSWFQKGTQDPIRIYNGTISNKGTCREVEGDKFLIENTLEKCYRCVVLHEKHINVLQYKETYCSSNPHHHSLETLCSEINGDALLYSMFRFNTPPVPCPFRGSFSFSYSRGHGECAYPASSIDSCTEVSHLLLRFQACADVMGSESRVEELVCLATWKEGSTRYLVGKLEHRVAKADEDKFRCFVYEQTEDGAGYQVAQSGDATCDGLFTANEGSRTMQLRRADHTQERCHYPKWFTIHSHWRGLDGRLAYDISEKNGSFSVSNATTGVTVKIVVCTRETTFHSNTYAQYVVHITSGCNSGYACLRLHKRAPHHVVEIQTSSVLYTQASEACNGLSFDYSPSEMVTLTTLSSGSLDCPIAGIFLMEGGHHHFARLISQDEEHHPPCSGTATLKSGCSASDKMELLQQCPAENKVKSFQCRGSWEENGTNYIIATAVGTRRHVCFAYSGNDKVLHFSGSTESCLRNIQLGREGAIALNGTKKGLCSTTSSATGVRDIQYYSRNVLIFVTCVIALLATLFCTR